MKFYIVFIVFLVNLLFSEKIYNETIIKSTVPIKIAYNMLQLSETGVTLTEIDSIKFTLKSSSEIIAGDEITIYGSNAKLPEIILVKDSDISRNIKGNSAKCKSLFNNHEFNTFVVENIKQYYLIETKDIIQSEEIQLKYNPENKQLFQLQPDNFIETHVAQKLVLGSKYIKVNFIKSDEEINPGLIEKELMILQKAYYLYSEDYSKDITKLQKNKLLNNLITAKEISPLFTHKNKISDLKTGDNYWLRYLSENFMEKHKKYLYTSDKKIEYVQTVYFDNIEYPIYTESGFEGELEISGESGVKELKKWIIPSISSIILAMLAF
ncbi:MAG: hypothetical protein ISR90_05860 [Candidatus Marinimicrobia bacterium]|nr:hypothetical protein [Candidatus Neomarinimicrobiota bacterium]MBL7023559.1 hypothetical protein [Candidatus Neomarinimicrobiota bacterium]